MSITVLIVDVSHVFRKGLRAVLFLHPDVEVVGEAGSGGEALELVRKLRPNIVFLDLLLPDVAGATLIEAIRAESPDVQVIVLTDVLGREQICKALEAGARSYLSKDIAPQELVFALRTVNCGQHFIPPRVGARLAEHVAGARLSSREVEVLQLISAGQKNKEIAYSLHISEATVNAHVKHILRKLSVCDRTQAVTAALRDGIIGLEHNLAKSAHES